MNARARPAWGARLTAILVLAAAVRVALLVAQPHVALFGDPSDYERWAASLAGGHGFPPTVIASPGTPSAFRPPVYPLALAAVYLVAGVHVTAGRALGVALGVLCVGLVAWLGRAVWDERLGLIAGGLAAVFPPLVELSGSLVSEALFIPLELAFALSLVALVRHPGQVRWAVLAGALCAAAILTRAVAVPWAVVGLTVAAGAGPGRVRRATALVAVLVVVMAPWTVRNAIVLHGFVPVTTEGGYTVAGQYNATVAAPGPLQSVWQIPLIVPDVAGRLAPLYDRRGGVNEVELDAALRGIARRYVERHPGDVVTAIAHDALRLLDLGPGHGLETAIGDRELGVPGWLRDPTTASVFVLVALALVGLAVGVTRHRLGPWWLWAVPLTALAVTVPAVGTPLKRAPADPFLILLAAAALEAALSGRAGPWWRADARSASR